MDLKSPGVPFPFCTNTQECLSGVGNVKHREATVRDQRGRETRRRAACVQWSEWGRGDEEWEELNGAKGGEGSRILWMNNARWTAKRLGKANDKTTTFEAICGSTTEGVHHHDG